MEADALGLLLPPHARDSAPPPPPRPRRPRAAPAAAGRPAPYGGEEGRRGGSVRAEVQRLLDDLRPSSARAVAAEFAPERGRGDDRRRRRRQQEGGGR